MNQYLQGSLVTTSAVFTDDVTRAQADHTSVTLKVGTSPTSESVYTYPSGGIVRDAMGNYHFEIDTTSFAPGIWYYQWVGTGGVQAIAAVAFQVLPAPL